MTKEKLLELLQNHLTVEVVTEHWTDPNGRTLTVKFDGEEVCKTTFCVKDQPEYEG